MDHMFVGGRLSYINDQRFGVTNNRRQYVVSTRHQDTDLLDDEFDPFFNDEQLEPDIDTSLSAPPQSHWFHGKLDRCECERRLKSIGRSGSYLIRESDRKNGYVLSYLGQNGINHFRITAICGDYYVGGRKFKSLSHLIGYYTSLSDLLKKERLLHPVQPPEPVSDYKYLVARLPYSKMPDTDELTVQKGDVLVVHNDLGDGWYWCTSYRTQESGLVFADLVEELDDSVDPNEMFPWFHSNIKKEEAVEKLAKMGPGSFLVRKSERSPGNYSLFFHIKNTVQRFRIERFGQKYVMGGRTFNNLNDVISRYRKEQIVEGACLGDPVLRSPHQIVLRTRANSKNLVTVQNSNNSQNNAAAMNNASSVLVGGDGHGGNSQDVYATLRESREMAKKKQSVFFKSYLMKKSQKSKKWKRLYFVINSSDQHLLWFDNEKRAKPKGLVDLSYSYIYLVHDSLFERPFCFQIVERALPCIATHHYLAAENLQDAQEWMRVLRPMCVPQQPRVKSPSLQHITEVRTLYITLLEAHRLPVKLAPHPYCIMSLNQVRVCRTQVKCPPDPVWEEDFVLEEIPNDVTSFTITVFNKGKRSSSKDTEVAEMSVEFAKLKNGQEVEEWYSLNGLTTPCRDDWGALRVRVRYVHEVIMPLRDYGILKELLMNEDLEVISVLEDFCHRDRAPLAHALLRIFRYERKEATLLKAMIEREIRREYETATLFRMNSLTTTVMDQYMRATCTQFLESALQESMRRVMDTRQSCELNPSKLDSLAEACANAEMLLNLLDDVVDCIFHSVESCPPMLRFICSCLQRNVAAKWPDEPLVKTRVVGGFIFLRLICPAILNPRAFNLTDETPSEMAARSLILIAKCLQNLANLVEFGTKSSALRQDDFAPFMNREPWMEVVNPFILKNKAKMIKFLDDIAMVYDCPEPENTARGDPSRELATVHSICEMHKEQIVNLSHARPTLKKLAVVTDMLSKRKQHFAAESQPTS